MKTLLRILAVAVVVMGFAVWRLGPWHGRHRGAGEIEGGRLPAEVVASRDRAQLEARYGQGATRAGRTDTKQILFGDLHVHTTFSTDAFLRSLPIMQGEGAHPPADACDFARFCSGLDFWSINDHAEAISPARWAETQESILQCNAIAGDPIDPDLVSFLGWEWTQVGTTPEDHYGHKNVIFRETDPERVPSRPISARTGIVQGALATGMPLGVRFFVPLLDFPERQQYWDFWRYFEEMAESPPCPEDLGGRELPDDCHEVAATPAILFDKLRQWDLETMVIPHGTTWGFYTPPGSALDKQLVGDMHDPELQTLFEVFSGHGNSEEYRDWRAVEYDSEGVARCPEPRDGYVPCCWQAGELIRRRCAEDLPGEECDARVEAARQNFVDVGVAGHRTVPGASAEDWLGCGQCPDCFDPSFNYRPGGSAQYALAISNFDGEEPRRFRFGFIASSDNHSARPGTGYKEFARRRMTEATGTRDAAWRTRLLGADAEPQPESQAIDPLGPDAPSPFQLAEFERQASFFMTGGLVAAHAVGRSREDIWDALERREVYGTSGDRILLWFDLLNGPEGAPQPMGADVELPWNPRFQVRAMGAFEQLPACPEHSLSGLSPERLESLCLGQCYQPGERRRRITRIEVVRIRPQTRPGEPVETLIEDPWRRFACARDAAGCTVEFEDPEFRAERRDVIYYARAIQEPTPAVNAGGLRCTLDEAGECVEVDPCYGDYRTPYDDDCLSPTEERAWSSPIFLRSAASARSASLPTR